MDSHMINNGWLILEISLFKGAPVELPFEVLSEATFTGISMSRQRQEIHPSVYCQYQNHGINEETFKIVSYICSPIERRLNNQTYLIKWLIFIHNLFIFNYKVTKKINT